MTNSYGIVFDKKRIAFGYVSPHSEYTDHIVVSVIPLERKGKWEDPSLQYHFENPVHDIFPNSKPEIEALEEVIAQIGIEPFKVCIQLLDERYHKQQD